MSIFRALGLSTTGTGPTGPGPTGPVGTTGTGGGVTPPIITPEEQKRRAEDTCRWVSWIVMALLAIVNFIIRFGRVNFCVGAPLVPRTFWDRFWCVFFIVVEA